MLAIAKPAKDGLVYLPCSNNALLQAPVWEDHHRGTNYLAVIDIDGASPGGLARRFLSKGKGDVLYMIDQLAAFDAVEFAADYTTGVGKRKRERWHGVVHAKEHTRLVLQPFETGALAVLRAKELRQARDALSWGT